jgi:hypothetical protein
MLAAPASPPCDDVGAPRCGISCLAPPPTLCRHFAAEISPDSEHSFLTDSRLTRLV